jgi:ParB family transcriptional regulator, chromosome partitioning protein
MAGDKKPRFMTRQPRPHVATAEDFEEVFARQASSRTHTPMDIPIDRIQPSPFQIRKTFDDISELAASIRLHGFTSRLWVREHPAQPGMYQLIFGERRLRAAKQAGLTRLPCDVTQFSDVELREIGLTENLQRRDLQPLEEAEGFRQFIDEFGYSVRSLAERIGKDKSYVQSRLSLLRAPDDVRDLVAQRPDTIRAALEISKLPTAEARRPLLDGVARGTLSKESVRTTIRDLTSRHAAANAAGDHDVERLLARDYRSFSTMIARWQALQARGAEEQALVAQYVEAVLSQVRSLMESMEE